MMAMRHLKKHLHFFFRATALIFLWRGAWHLMDMWLFPNDAFSSNLASLVIGAGLLLMADTIFMTKTSQETREERRHEREYAPQE